MTDIFAELSDLISKQDINGTVEATKNALAAGTPALDIVQKGLAAGMKIVGDKFENGELFYRKAQNENPIDIESGK